MPTCLLTAALVLGTSTQAPSDPSEDWAGLDRELERLAAAYQEEQDAFGVEAIVRFSYATSRSNALRIPPSNHPLGGFIFDNLRLRFGGEYEGFGWRIETESSAGVLGGTGATVILDAYVTKKIIDWIEVVVGQFRAPYAWSGLQDIEDVLFINRTTPGALTAIRDQGVMVKMDYDFIHSWTAVTNGVDGTGDDTRLTSRLTLVALGDELRVGEGARGAEGPYLALGAAAAIDPALDESFRTGYDIVGGYGPIMAHVEHIHQLNDPVIGNNANAQQFSATISGSPHEKVELAARYQQLNEKVRGPAGTPFLGTLLNTRQFQFGVNYYHNDAVKLQANWSTAEISDPGTDTDIFSIGATVSI